jgi:hypothetical protein
LTELDFAQSREVTNASVQHLRGARKLKFLHLGGTRIDYEPYAMILSELRNIANITFQQDEASLLSDIPAERLRTIAQVSGHIQDIYIVAHKCPNTTSINMHPVVTDLFALTAFNHLSALTIHNLDYDTSNLKAVLQVVGHRLTDLKLSHFERVVLQDIITLCPSLANFSLTYCSFLNLNLNTQFDPQLPHFRNLIKLEVGNLDGSPNVCRFIGYYVSLKTIFFTDWSIFTVEVVEYIVHLGTYKQLEILRVEKYINADALEQLIPHCPLLKRIELVGSTRLGTDVFREIKRQIVLQNFDLKFKEYYKAFRSSL